jgi:hypothetical protein
VLEQTKGSEPTYEINKVDISEWALIRVIQHVEGVDEDYLVVVHCRRDDVALHREDWRFQDKHFLELV